MLAEAARLPVTMQMPRTAIDDLRPSTLAAVLLTAALALALQCHDRGAIRACGGREIAVLAPPAATGAPPAIGFGALIVPPEHSDARPWPLGMVITPPPTADAINLFVPPSSLSDVVNRVLALLATARRAEASTAS